MAPGTRLIGTVLPELVAAGSAGRATTERGWFALLAVETDAATVMQRYAAQAMAQGYGNPGTDAPNGAGCLLADEGDVRCRLDYRAADRRLDVRVRVCRSCPKPIAIALLRAAPERGLAPSGPGRVPPRGPSERLDSDQQRRAAEYPEPGEQLFPVAGGFRYDPTIRVVAGSEVAGLMSGGQVCERDFVAVLSVAGAPRRVLDRYAAQVFESPPTTRRHARVDGFDVTELANDSWTVSLVEGGGLDAPLLKLDWCA